jgi:pimeloyl-ACP methyl ester carboxylesterase
VSAGPFGAPLRDGFEVSMDGYLDWLVASLEQFKEPVDLVGHDYGALHVFNLAMNRPDLIRSWACDAVGVFHPDYQWHELARLVQTPGEGERFVQDRLQSSLEQLIADCREWGVREPVATRLAAGFDEPMWRAVLTLYRSAAQPALAQAGQKASATLIRAGLTCSERRKRAGALWPMRRKRWSRSSRVRRRARARAAPALPRVVFFRIVGPLGRVGEPAVVGAARQTRVPGLVADQRDRERVLHQSVGQSPARGPVLAASQLITLSYFSPGGADPSAGPTCAPRTNGRTTPCTAPASEQTAAARGQIRSASYTIPAQAA